MQEGNIAQTAEEIGELAQGVAGLSGEEQQALGRDLTEAAREIGKPIPS